MTDDRASETSLSSVQRAASTQREARVPAVPVGFQAVWSLIRPRQWVKNSFVLAPLVFAVQISNPVALRQAVAATFLFCLASSAVYIFNDWRDLDGDRAHPTKRFTRPLAAETVSVRTAGALLILLWLVVIGVAAWWPPVGVGLLVYVLLNAAYSVHLKRVPVVDIFCVAAGFVLRVASGAAAIAVPLSAWMLITTLCLALYLAAVKRRQELVVAGQGARHVLGAYTIPLLDRYAQMAATAALVFYGLFASTVRPELAGTTAFVLFGFFRYSYLVEAHEAGENPTEVLWRDRPLAAVVVLWAVTAVWLVAL
ncbi:MAG: decaprenyl-phosphate phosphoribosyltransferase [Candidatus Sericytochromatia bacterium]|nr:decaprenyl-phosphate phosphoribosyltransferase [Candidatus Sericytochromatia bacterium]